jgi:Ni,Fe-hydrogenase I cytochrome b subunit
MIEFLQAELPVWVTFIHVLFVMVTSYYVGKGYRIKQEKRMKKVIRDASKGNLESVYDFVADSYYYDYN